MKALVINHMWKQTFAFPGVLVISAQPSVAKLFRRRASVEVYPEENLHDAIHGEGV